MQKHGFSDADAFYVDLTPLPANDAFASALRVEETSWARLVGHGVGATREAGEPDLSQTFSGASVWYRLKAATYGDVRLGSAITLPFAMAVFEGTSLANLRWVEDNEGSGSITIFGEEGVELILKENIRI